MAAFENCQTRKPMENHRASSTCRTFIEKLLLSSLLVSWLAGMYSAEPIFDVPLVNVTVVAGQNIVLQCSIEKLESYKVIWLDPDSLPLTYEDRRVIDDHRFSLVRSNNKEWNLSIRNVRLKDFGPYRCTVNTEPVRSKMVNLHVKVAPQIIDSLSSKDVTVIEGDTIALRCNVTGVPHPDVTWYRKSKFGKVWPHLERLGAFGEVLLIQNVTRYCGDIYRCVASNGVPPSDSREMTVTVQFPPTITLPNRRIGQRRGREALLECSVASFPIGSHWWQTSEGRQVVTPSPDGRHNVEIYEESQYLVTVRLSIFNLQPSDFGNYTCCGINSLGKDCKTISLYEYRDGEHSRVKSEEKSDAIFNRSKLTAKPSPSVELNGINILHGFSLRFTTSSALDRGVQNRGHIRNTFDKPERFFHTKRRNWSSRLNSEVPLFSVILLVALQQHRWLP